MFESYLVVVKKMDGCHVSMCVVNVQAPIWVISSLFNFLYDLVIIQSVLRKESVLIDPLILLLSTTVYLPPPPEKKNLLIVPMQM